MYDYSRVLRESDDKVIQKHWYIWYTQPRVEKKVKKRLEAEDIEVFLPLTKQLRQWSDRKKWVEVPLFRGYIFTKVSPRRFQEVYYTTGIVTYIRFEGEPAIMSEDEIHLIQQLITDPEDLEVVHHEFYEGERVQVITGPLMGVEGFVYQQQGAKKVAVNIHKLGKSVLVQVPLNNLRKITESV